MREIQLRHANATWSAVDDAVRGEPSIITRHGRPETVVIGFDDRACRAYRRSLLVAAPLASDDLLERDHAPLREVGP